MASDKKIPTGGYEIVKEGDEEVMKINLEEWPYVPSIEDNALVMAMTIDKLVEVPSTSRIVFAQRKHYSYDYEQTQMLNEVAMLYNRLVKQKRALSVSAMGTEATAADLPRRYALVQDIVFNLMRSDPLGAYVELKRVIRDEKLKLRRMETEEETESEKMFIDLLQYIHDLLDRTKLVDTVKQNLPGYHIGDRSLYATIFKPTITPDFLFTRLMAQIPLNARELDVYTVGNTEVNLLSIPEDIKYVYHVTPPEFKLTEDKYMLIDYARQVLAEHQPREEEFLEPEKMRTTFTNIGKDLIQELAENRGIDLDYEELKELAEILVRYTVGFGLVEILLQDDKIQDVTINGPIGQTPIFIVHQDYDECTTNIIPSKTDAQSWASKFRMLSGRPLDEANPILDTELRIPGARARVAIVQNPLNPYGLSYTFRRHRDKPWTLPLFIKNRMMNPLAAGLMSFMIDGSRTILIAGTRSSGKTSLLGAVLVEIMRKYRIITIEDTLEIPAEALRNLGYNIQPLKVRSALTTGGTEIAADEGIRTALRMGDSSLIVGEIRSSIPGWEEILIIENGITRRAQIGQLENKDIKNYKVPTLGFDLKVGLKPLTAFVKHPKRNRLLKIITKTGRNITVTPDHSLFCSTKDFKIAPVECKELKKGDPIVIPSYIPPGFNDIEHLNTIDMLPEFKIKNFEADTRKAIHILGWKKATKIASITKGDIYNYFRTAKNQHINLPISSFQNLMQEAEIEFNPNQLSITRGTGNPIPAVIPVNKDFCKFLGYYLSEGYYVLKEGKGGRVVLSNSNETIREDMFNTAKNLFNFEPKLRKTYGAGECTQITLTSCALATLLDRLDCGRTCTEKRIPAVIFGLSKPKIAAFLRALFSGDGSFTASHSSGNCVSYSSTSKGLIEDLAYLLLTFGIVGSIRYRKANPPNSDTWILEFKDREMVRTFLDEIGFEHKKPSMIIKGPKHTVSNGVRFSKEELKKHLTKYPRKYRHLFRFERCSKGYLKQVANDKACEASERLKTFANGEFFLDEIKEIQELELKKAVSVYDLSVEPSQNFIGGFGGILLHNTEAKSLYEAMRIGALANVVAGTIHGDSPYGVFDRVVNDLQVPRTSFKATDVILIANPIKSPDGLHKWRRMTSITEVRKFWEEDPLRERGFVDLMKYNSKTDTLEPTDDLINGDSEVLKSIAGNVKDWVGNWGAVWENVMLRANIKEKMVQYAEKQNMPDILEADFVILSNDQFHRISDDVREEVGALDTKRILYEWEEWLKKKIKEKKGF